MIYVCRSGYGVFYVVLGRKFVLSLDGIMISSHAYMYGNPSIICETFSVAAPKVTRPPRSHFLDAGGMCPAVFGP